MIVVGQGFASEFEGHGPESYGIVIDRPIGRNQTIMVVAARGHVDACDRDGGHPRRGWRRSPGIPFSSLLDTPMMMRFAAIAELDDVLVLLSHIGRWNDFVHVAKAAKERGATVIAITNPESELATTASILFSCRV